MFGYSAKCLLTPRAASAILQNFLKMSTGPQFETLSVKVPDEFVYHVELNRPEKKNAVNDKLSREIGECFNQLRENEDCRVIVFSAAGPIFTSGLDYTDIISFAPKLAQIKDVARKAKLLRPQIRKFQNSINSLEQCEKPVLSAIHSACVGIGVSYVTAADMRYCTRDAWFQVKEVDLGLAADVGTLQRLPAVIGSDSLARELCYTVRRFPADEALSSGFVSSVFEDKESMLKAVIEVAKQIASKSPVAVQATKKSLVYSRDHSVQEGLDHIANWNQAMLQSEDFTTAAIGAVSKQTDIKFPKL